MALRLIQGLLLAKEPDQDNKGYVVTLRCSFNNSESPSKYYVPKNAAFVEALAGSGSTLEDDASFERNKDQPARLVLDGNGLVVAFRASHNAGYDSIQKIADCRIKQRQENAPNHNPKDGQSHSSNSRHSFDFLTRIFK